MDRNPVVCVPHLSAVGPSPYSTVMTFDVKLESESELSSSDMDESICSAQMDLTASCQDTPDTETDSSSSLESEFSVASSISDAPTLPEISSGPEDIYEAANLAFSLVRDKRCIRCHTVKTSPFLHCKRCYADRKRFLPTRPIRRKKPKRIGLTKSSTASKDANCSNSTSAESWRQSLCGCCMEAPCNGVFIHADVGHQIFCYQCAHRVWLERKNCPYCNRSISKVIKLFRVDFE